ncbi:hypothetical protein AJ79_02685 [Helicocarpus griseus UAMH5409]|uniref:Uncharacterized protein n=1 Tax=Helicocarpus griseus UAMH5409 TaxID=1447875 RepID=A0A2B7Y1D9_9EURO|nr:hypothetical protein AJ79_02685 [Helicocarpus griseus UAMH5409]
MPYIVREITPERPVLSREAGDDERYVMEEFSKHTVECFRCNRPYEAFCKGRPLCPAGNGYAHEVLKYIYQKCGRPYSVVDREQGRYVRMEIPDGCQVVLDLLKALDEGLVIPRPRRPHRPQSVIVHNSEANQEPRILHIQPLSRRPVSSAVIPHRRMSRDDLYIYRRGSLYSSDLSRQSSPGSNQRVRIPDTYLR